MNLQGLFMQLSRFIFEMILFTSKVFRLVFLTKLEKLFFFVGESLDDRNYVLYSFKFIKRMSSQNLKKKSYISKNINEIPQSTSSGTSLVASLSFLQLN